MGTIHNTNDPNYRLGSMEQGNASISGALILNQQDLQNMVNSDEFQLTEDYSLIGPRKPDGTF
jgi:hypothetical protein